MHHPQIGFALSKDRQRELRRVAERHLRRPPRPARPGVRHWLALWSAGWGRWSDVSSSRPAMVGLEANGTLTV